ncbi:MAG: ABC transporter permease, partial [Clostridiales bacterium]|nr:ABC transporter permease [Clostridiales bacterium]
MVVGIKDCFKLIGISIIAFCAVFVCTLFLNYNLDLIAIKDSISSESLPLYNALVSMGKVVCIVSGGCLIITSLIMLMYYVKNYIDIHGKELGIMKAIGYTNLQIAKHFWVFGASVLVGCVFGFIVAFAYMPTFYNQQNADLLIDMQVKFHPILVLSLIVAPTLLFLIVAVLYAYLKLKTPVLDLLKEKNEYKFKAGKREAKGSFLQSL